MSPGHTCGVFIELSVDRCGKSSTEQAALFSHVRLCSRHRSLNVKSLLGVFAGQTSHFRPCFRRNTQNEPCAQEWCVQWLRYEHRPVYSNLLRKVMFMVAELRVVDGGDGGDGGVAPLLGGDRGSCPDFFALLCRPLISHKGPQWQLAHSDHTWKQGAWQTRWEWHTQAQAGRKTICSLAARRALPRLNKKFLWVAVDLDIS